MKRQAADSAGRAAENMAAKFLEGQGFTILAQRRKTKSGEIDLIAGREGLIVFAEVKWRAKAADLDIAIDEHRLSRVAAAAELVAHEYATKGEDLRVDVILLAPGAQPRHITNAWMP